ncbi:hypothetical protein JCM30566_04830 [Marinitoga arctica]
MKKVILSTIVLLFNLIIFSRLNNIYIDYSYTFYNNNNNNNFHSLYLGYNLGNIPLKIQFGTQNDFQFIGVISAYTNINNLYIEPYIKYTKDFSLGFKFSINHLYFDYNVNKFMTNIFGLGFYFPIIKFGEDIGSYVISKNYIKETVGNDIKIKMFVKNKGVPAENIEIFYTLNNSDKLYIGKTNEFGEITLKLSNITKSGIYKVKIFNSDKKIKEIILELLPDEPYRVSFSFDKDFIFTDNEEIIKIKNINIYDKYNNEIYNYNIRFINFKILGIPEQIKYSYLNNSLIFQPFKEKGEYNLYYEINVNNKYLNGLKKIIVKNNPKNIIKSNVDINYIGNENNYMIFEIKKPEIYFSNSTKDYADRYFIYFNNKRINIKNGRFKIPIEGNFSKTVNFEVSVGYYNFSTVINKNINIKN